MVRIFCLAVLAAVMCITAGYAQEKTASDAVKADIPVAPSAVTPSVGLDPASKEPVQASPKVVPEAVMEFKMSQNGNVSLDFRDADIKNVLKVLAYKSGVNIISGPEVIGMVNIQLKDVPWQKALDVILSTYGYSYEQKGTIIMVTTLDNLKKRREDAKLLADQEPLATRTFVLNFSKAEDAVKSLEKMKTSRGSVNFDTRTNSVIVTDVESNLELIKEIVKTLDTVTPQVLIEARIMETTLDKKDTMGVKWNLSVGASGGRRDTTLPWLEPSSGHLLPATTISSAAEALAPVYGTLNASGLSATLDMLKTNGKTKTLSNPQIVTLDNQPAKVQVGYQYPMPQYTSDSQTGVLHISGWNYMDIGLVFDVTPHINNANLVTLDISPKILGFKATNPPDNVSATAATMQVLTNQAISTKVMIKNGETLVIAGLVTDNLTKIQSRVPVLGYIPVLGWFFQHTEDEHTKTELMIFLTPHIITATMDTAPAISPTAADAVVAGAQQ